MSIRRVQGHKISEASLIFLAHTFCLEKKPLDLQILSQTSKTMKNNEEVTVNSKYYREHYREYREYYRVYYRLISCLN